MGGDYITSTLVPLSTGINMEDQLLNIAMGAPVDTQTGRIEKASSICWMSLNEGFVKSIDKELYNVINWPHVMSFDFKLSLGSKVNQITNSLNRYGHFIVEANNRDELDKIVSDYEKRINGFIQIDTIGVKQ